jgi:peptide/nickel transport system substrate-binding protein
MNKRYIAIVLVMSLLVAMLASLTSSNAQDDRPELVIGVQNLPPVLEPLRENTTVFMRYIYTVFDTLIEFDATTFELKPGLAESWRRIDDRTLELTLRQDVTFHNGAAFTAADVVFTFGPERMFNEKLAGYGNAQQFLGTFESVEAVDDYTVRVTTNVPDPLLEQRLTDNIAAIVSKQAFEDAADYEAFSLMGIGTGPYKFVEFVTDDYVRLEPFDDYYGGTPDFSSVTFKVVPEVSTRVAGLIAGDFDIITDIPSDQLDVIDDNDGTSVVGGPVRNIRVIVYDVFNNDVLTDPKLRLAMNYAIDRELIVATLFDGRTAVPPGMQFEYYGEMFLEDFTPQGYDLDMAKQLVAESNYDGETITYRLLPNYFTFQLEIAEVLQQMWAAAGINVELEVVENWDQVTSTETPRFMTDLSTTMKFADPVGHLWRVYGSNGLVQSAGFWSNEEFNALGATLVSSTDLEERRAAFQRMMEIHQNEDPAGTFLYYLPIFYGKSDKVDWTPTVYEHLDLRPDNIDLLD